MYGMFSRLYPARMREHIKSLLAESELKADTEKFLGVSVVLSIIVSALAVVFIFFKWNLIISYLVYSFAAVFIVSQISSYLFLVFKAEGKARFVESILPDALQLTASNLKAGFTMEKALLLSARPEFGSFSVDLNTLGKEIATGKQIEQAMLELTHRVRSEKLEKSILLIVDGIRSGGELATLLTQTAQNLRSQMLLEERVRASVLMYFIFIMSAVAFAAPMIFSLSSFLAEIMTKQLQTIGDLPSGINTPITVAKVQLSLDFIIGFAIITLVTLCIFGSIALGLIRKGDGRQGLRYAPFMIASSLATFFLIRRAIAGMFAGLI